MFPDSAKKKSECTFDESGKKSLNHTDLLFDDKCVLYAAS